MPNRRKRPEEALHRSVAQYLDVALPDGSEWFHIPNGGARSKAEAGVFKALGVKPGMPDIAVIYNGVFHGAELKPVGGRLSKNQIERHKRLKAAGARVTVCTSVEEIERFLAGYMPLKASLTGGGPLFKGAA